MKRHCGGIGGSGRKHHTRHPGRNSNYSGHSVRSSDLLMVSVEVLRKRQTNKAGQLLIEYGGEGERDSSE